MSQQSYMKQNPTLQQCSYNINLVHWVARILAVLCYIIITHYIFDTGRSGGYPDLFVLQIKNMENK